MNRQIKQAIRDKYAWPGGYALYIVTTDGGVLCPACARAEFRQLVYASIHKLNDGWNPAAVGCTANDDEPPTCDHCNKTVD